jgi:hypothetical protein
MRNSIENSSPLLRREVETEPIPPQPPILNQPAPPTFSRRCAAWFMGTFRPVHPTTSTPFSVSTSQGSKDIQGKRNLAAGELRTATQSGKETKIDRRQNRTGEMVNGQHPQNQTPYAGTGRDAVHDALRGMFDSPPQGTAETEQRREDLLNQLDGFCSQDSTPYARPLLIGKVISHLTRDPDEARALLTELHNPDATGEAFFAQLALMRCHGPGFDAMAACQPIPNLSQGPFEAAIQNEAFRQKLTAAHALCDLLPLQLRPQSMAQCLALAEEASQPPREGEGEAPASEAANIVRNHPIVVEALRCASMLMADPLAMPPTEMKTAYLAFRNGIRTAEDLTRTANRLHKVNTYIDRATEHGKPAFGNGLKRRVLGTQKNPLKALVKLGTAGSKTRHPEDDLAKRTVAMDAAIDALNAQLADLPESERTSDMAQHKSIMTAVIRQWKSHIVSKGWKDTLHVDRGMRRAIAEDVARQLGLNVRDVLSRPELHHMSDLTVATLAHWVQHEALDVPPQAMADFAKLDQRGDVFINHPDRAQVRQLLREGIQDTRQTYNVNFSSTTARGVVASVADVIGATSLAGMPVLYAGPGLTALRTNAADIRGGSNVHGGLIGVNTTQGGSGALSATVGFGWKVLEFLNVGPSATGTPIKIDHASSDGVAVRTRMNPIGSDDPDAWRTKLLEIYDTITDEPAGEPTDAPQDGAIAMWDRLAELVFKDPNVSIQSQTIKQTNIGGVGSAGVSATVDPTGSGAFKVGPNTGVSFQKTYLAKTRGEDQGGQSRVATLHAASAGHGWAGTAGLFASAPPVTGPFAGSGGHFGETQQLTMPSGALTSSAGFGRNAAGATVRLVEDQGRLQPDYCVIDTEIGHAKDFAKYIDSQRAVWLAGLGGGAQAEAQLDEFLTHIVNDEVTGNMTYGERRRLTPQAGQKIDNLKAQIAAVELLTNPTPEEKAEIKSLKGEVTRVINDAGSWDPRSLWALGLNTEQKTTGLNLILAANRTYAVTAPRQNAVLVATHATNREIPTDAEITHF